MKKCVNWSVKLMSASFAVSLLLYVAVAVYGARHRFNRSRVAGVSWSSDVSLLETLMASHTLDESVSKLDRSTKRRLRILTTDLVGRGTIDDNGIAVLLQRRLDEYFKKRQTRIVSRQRDNDDRLDIHIVQPGLSYASYVYFHNNIRRNHLYSPSESGIRQLEEDMLQQTVVEVAEQRGGSQLKLVLTTRERLLLLWKPYRYGRDKETLPDHFYFSDFERFNAEIAAYHLDRILKFYRTPPTIGRDFNITDSFLPNAGRKLVKTFFVSPAGNVCFHGSCKVYCDTGHSVCGRPEFIEGSISAYLPPMSLAKRKSWLHPWRRTYNKHRTEAWLMDDNYCEKVKGQDVYSKGRRLLDIIDMAIFDFLIGNMDRHHYETFLQFGNNTFLLHLDNGKGFGKSGVDELTILAPLRQCCEVRASTARRLVVLAAPTSPPLSQRMRASLARDSLPRLLAESHLVALDRRVKIVLAEILTCLDSGKDALLDDGF